MKAPPPQSTAGDNYTRFACLPDPVIKAPTLACKDAMLHRSGEHKAEPGYFVYVYEYLDDGYPDNEGDYTNSMGSLSIYTGNSNAFDLESNARYYSIAWQASYLASKQQ